MTEFIHIDADIDYPVGECIVKNIGEVKRMAEALKARFPDKDMTLWVTGSSGAIISALVCSHLTCRTVIIYVKKPGEENHQQETTYYLPVLPDSIHVIVDDFTRSFKTVTRVIKEMEAINIKPDCLCLGGSLNGRSMDEYSDYFPVIIANYIYIPDGNSIKSDCVVDIGEKVKRWKETKKQEVY